MNAKQFAVGILGYVACFGAGCLMHVLTASHSVVDQETVTTKVEQSFGGAVEPGAIPDLSALPHGGTQLPSLDSRDYVSELERLAPDNPLAAYQLSELKQKCRFLAPASPDAIDALVSARAANAMAAEEELAAEIKREHAIDVPPSSLETIVERAEREATTLIATKAHCSRVTDDSGSSWLDLLEQAATAGHPKAQIEYWRAALYEAPLDIAQYPRRKALAMQFLSEALRRGEPEALPALAHIHGEGLLGAPDQMMAYAFLVAYAKATATSTLDQWLASSMLTPSTAPHLSSEDRAMAEAIGGQIAMRCCS